LQVTLNNSVHVHAPIHVSQQQQGGRAALLCAASALLPPLTWFAVCCLWWLDRVPVYMEVLCAPVVYL
jgi:hypothetical protein